MQFTEFIDNSLKALKDAPPGTPKVIDTYVLQEQLPEGGDFAGLIVRDSGVGMGQADMNRWRMRGSMPVRSSEVRACPTCPWQCDCASHEHQVLGTHKGGDAGFQGAVQKPVAESVGVQEAAHNSAEDLAAAELRRAFLMDTDLSTFGRGASEAGFALGHEVAIVAKLAGSSKVWELVGTNKGNQFWDDVSIESRDRLEQTAHNIAKGVRACSSMHDVWCGVQLPCALHRKDSQVACATCVQKWAKSWKDSSVTKIPGADKSQHLPRLMHYMESFGTSEGTVGGAAVRTHSLPGSPLERAIDICMPCYTPVCSRPEQVRNNW